MLRRLAFALLAVIFGVTLATADEVKKDVKKGAQETKEATEDAAKATKNEVRNDSKGAIHKATGKVKSVTANSLTVTEETGKELTFEVDKDTLVHAKGATHKMEALKADGKPTLITEFVLANQHVSVRYSKPEDRMMAKDIQVKP